MYNCGIVFRTLGYKTLLQFMRKNATVISNYPLSLAQVGVDENHFEFGRISIS